MSDDMRNRRTKRVRRARRSSQARSNNQAAGILSNFGGSRKLAIQILGIIGCIVIVLVGAFIVAGSKPGNVPDSSFTEEDKERIIKDNIYIDKTSLMGLSLGQAEEIIKERSEHMLGTFTLYYASEVTEYSVTAAELGLSTNREDVLNRLLEKGKDGADEVKTISETESKYIYKLNYSADSEKVLSAVEASVMRLRVEPVNAHVDVIKSSDEDRLQQYSTIDYVEGINGSRIEAAPLAESFMQAIENGDSGKIFVANAEAIEPEIKLSDIEGSYSKMASYSTVFKDSKEGRRYNVWKMAGFVNGLILQPGEVWSINEAAGPRYEQYGWREAAGINDGAYEEQFGGGICQVSSTLYNAVLRAELKIEKRSHHSWPVDYVPKGLDATISTGSPDFIISNPYDIPVIILVNCDAKNEKKITISVYGPKMDYTVDFETKIVTNEEPSSPPATKLDPSLSPGKSAWTKQRKNHIVVEVYKKKFDKETGEQIGEKQLHHTDTYRPKAGEISYGPSATPSPSKTPKPSKSQEPVHTPDKTPDNTQDPSIPTLPPVED